MHFINSLLKISHWRDMILVCNIYILISLQVFMTNFMKEIKTLDPCHLLWSSTIGWIVSQSPPLDDGMVFKGCSSHLIIMVKKIEGGSNNHYNAVQPFCSWSSCWEVVVTLNLAASYLFFVLFLINLTLNDKPF